MANRNLLKRMRLPIIALLSIATVGYVIKETLPIPYQITVSEPCETSVRDAINREPKDQSGLSNIKQVAYTCESFNEALRTISKGLNSIFPESTDNSSTNRASNIPIRINLRDYEKKTPFQECFDPKAIAITDRYVRDNSKNFEELQSGLEGLAFFCNETRIKGLNE